MKHETLKTEEIKLYIRAQRAKGRPMREIIREVAAIRPDFTILSSDLKLSEQQMLSALGQKQ